MHPNNKSDRWHEQKLLEQYTLLYSWHRKNIEIYNKATVFWLTVSLAALFFIFKGDIPSPFAQALSGIIYFIGTGLIISNALIWKHLRKFEAELKETSDRLDLPYVKAASFPAMVGQVIAFVIGIPVVRILFFVAISAH